MEKISTSLPSPPLPTRWTGNAFSWQRSLIVFGLLAAGFFAGQALLVIVIRVLHTTKADVQTSQLTWGIALGQYVSYLPILAVLLIALPWLAGVSLRELGLRWFDAQTVGAGVLGAVAMYVVTIGVAGVQFALTHEKPQEVAMSLFTSTHDRALIIAFTILAVFVAPFMEEFVFRGFLYNAFARYLPVWAAALVSGIVFGVSHGSPTAFLPLAGSGIVLAYVYARSGSLTASMITHALFNLINVALLALGKS